ncbi:MAG TPA: class D sortase [Fusibacter sp.]|nr:class D sortase [Fusibacter sp.]
MKTTNRTLFKRLSLLLVFAGVILVGMTVKSIFFQPDYSIKTDYIGKLNSVKDALANNEGINEGIKGDDNTEAIEVSYEPGDLIGQLIIPSLDYELPIYEGTEDAQLKKGVGRYIGSAYPGVTDNCVLSGHRDTVFTKLGDLEIGASIIVNTDNGLFSYEVTGIRIVEADDKTVIVPTDVATLTLTTCYPFVYIGAAPQRYIVTAKLSE